MGITRSGLKALSLNEDQINAIIEMYTETISGLKDTIDTLKAEKDDIQKKLDTANADWDSKYKKLEGDFTTFKNAQSAKEVRSAKEAAFRKLLKDTGVDEKRINSIMKISDIDSLKLDKEGNLNDSESLGKKVKEDWSDFIVKQTTKGAKVENPPANGGGKKMTKEEIMKITDRDARRAAIKENADVFGQ